LVFVILEQALVCTEFADVVVAEDLGEVTVLMSEHAAAAICASFGLVEGTAIFSSLFLISIAYCFEVDQFFISVCKLAFFPVAAAIVLDPIFAQFCLILLGCNFSFTLRRLTGCHRLIRWAARVC
jgi:hypothetical protein